LGAIINLERWKVSEGLDSDRGIIPGEGYSFSGDIKYNLQFSNIFQVYPYAGIGYEKLKKRAKPANWQTLRFYNWMAGLGTESERVYLKAAVTKPFSPSTSNGLYPKPRFGFSSEGGVNIWKNLYAGLFYKYSGFEKPDSKMTQSGLLVAYRLNIAAPN
jgi:opacity protein-like surface antigen